MSDRTQDDGTVIAKYEYDGLNRGVKKHIDTGRMRRTTSDNMTAVPKPSGLANTYACTYDAWNRVRLQENQAEVLAHLRLSP